MSTESLPQQNTTTADNLWLTDDLDSYIKRECNTNEPVSTVKEPEPDGDVMRLERKSSGMETSQLQSDDSVVLHDEGSSKMVADDGVDGNKSSDATKDQIDSRSKTTVEVQESGDAGQNTLASELYVVESMDRCIRCNKVRPPEQCPVCHSMYPSVATHIGVHSIRKIHTPSTLLEIQSTNEGGVSGLTGVSKTDERRLSDQPHMCTDCGEIFPNAKTLRSHVKSKSCLKFHVCMVCGTTCNSEIELQLHKKIHPNDDLIGNADEDKDSISQKEKCKDLSCAACDVEFNSAELLAQHMEEHVDKEERICQICRKTFMHADSLVSHMRSHTGKMPFQCEICGKACRTRKDLKEHREVHSTEKQHVCTTCGKQFRVRKTYMRHMVTHSGEKNYECDYCGMRFWFNYRRTRHMLVHTGEKPYVCDRCGERFTQWNGLSQHRLRSCRK